MPTIHDNPRTVDEYIHAAPPKVQPMLQNIRQAIREAAPEAEETIKYQIPTYVCKGNLISFAAYKKHIGLYPAPEGDDEFNRRLAGYITEKSTVRFALDKPIPYDLVSDIVRFRMMDNLKRAEEKARKKVRSE